jgi:hypothetical protein
MVFDLLDEDVSVLTGAPANVLVCALTERGAFDEARALLHERGLEHSLHGMPWESAVRHARARLWLAEGDFERALTEAQESGALRDERGRSNPTWTAWRSTAALALAHLGRREEAAAARSASRTAPTASASARGGRQGQSRDRPGALPEHQDRRDPSGGRVPQARRQRPRRPGGRARELANAPGLSPSRPRRSCRRPRRAPGTGAVRRARAGSGRACPRRRRGRCPRRCAADAGSIVRCARRAGRGR